MRTAVDTNIFVALYAGDEQATPAAQSSLEKAAGRGVVAVSPVVYAELAAGRSPDEVETFFEAQRIEVDWDLGKEIRRPAGSRYGEYSRSRRRGPNVSAPQCILADFVIGAHALHTASALLTLDRSLYRTVFPDLTVLTPA